MKRFLAALLALWIGFAPAIALAADKTPLTNYGGGILGIKAGDTTPCAVHPALTGDVTLTAGTCVTAIGPNKVTLGDIAQSGANTVLGNATASTANLSALSMPSCSTSISALKWTTSSGFGCTTLGTFADQSYATPPAIGGTTPAAGSFSSLKATNIASGTQCVHADSSGNLTGTGSDCGSGGGGSGAVTLISKVVTAGSAASVTFSSIPGTYTDLQIRVSGRLTDSANDAGVSVRFNGDTAAHYLFRQNYFNDSGISGNDGGTAQTTLVIGHLAAATATTSYKSQIIADIMGYTDTTWFKSMGARSSSDWFSGSTVRNILSYGLWQSTAAITSIDVIGNFANGSIVSLYGIS